MADRIQIIKDEITTDPKSLGYAGQTNQWIANKLNEIGASGETVDNDALPGHVISKAVVPSEYLLLDAANRDLLQFITSVQLVDIKDANIKFAISTMFGPGTQTRSNLLALTTKPIARSEVLGLGVVKYWDVARAKSL